MKLTKKDLDWAASEGVIETAQADALWDALSERLSAQPRFDLIHVAYYFGALLIIGALSWFVGLSWETLGGRGIFIVSLIHASAFLGIGSVLWRKPGLGTPGGLLITAAVCVTPLSVYGLQVWLDLWGFDNPGDFRNFHHWIRSGWFAMEIATVVVGLVALKFFRFPFLSAPIAMTLWYMSINLTLIIAGGDGTFDWDLRKIVSLWFGLVMIVASYGIDLRAKKDFAFWGYLFGTIAFWGGLSLLNSDSELSKFFYFLINLVMIGLSVFLRRIVFIVFGAVGAFGYVGHLAYTVFEDSVSFSLVLTLFGLAVIYAGVLLKRHHMTIRQRIDDALPSWACNLRPPEEA